MIACLGLAFKADIDDLRESPATAIVEALAEHVDATLLVVEPNIAVLPASLEGRVRLCDLNTALAEADVIVILVDHAPFRRMDPVRLQARVVIDTRGVLARG